jgi:hypothetical protein
LLGGPALSRFDLLDGNQTTTDALSQLNLGQAERPVAAFKPLAKKKGELLFSCGHLAANHSPI